MTTATSKPTAERRITIERIYWNSPADVFAITNAQGAGVPRLIPDTMRSLAGTGLVERTLNVMMMFRDESGTPIGMGSELEILPGTGDSSLEVFLTIALVGRGSLFVHELKNYAQPDRARIWSDVQETGKPWSGSLPVVSTVGPAVGNRGVILAGTGEFEGVTGTQYQTSTMRSVTKETWDNYVCETLELVWPA
jgi:hypothetical protein